MITTQETTHYDIIVVGAGLVGSSVIVGLQKAGFRIAVLEHHLPNVMTNNQQDSRPISLAYGSQQVLDHWGIWSALATAACPIDTVHVSSQGYFGRVKFSADEYDLPALGYVVPFAQLQQALYQKAASLEQVSFISIEKLNQIECEHQAASVSYRAADKDHKISADLLIAADGAQSTCRQLLRIDTVSENLGEVAHIAAIDLASPHQGIAYERFTKKGTMAILPLFDAKQCRLVWTMDKAQSDEVSTWDSDTLLSALKNVFGERLGPILKIEKQASFPLQTTLAKTAIKERAVLLGNAAHTIYPLAAQGFNLGLQDAVVLARVLSQAKDQKQSIGDAAVLQRYVDLCAHRQKRVIGFTNGIAKVFRWQWPLLGHCRAMGLLGVDLLPFLKNDFAKTLMHV